MAVDFLLLEALLQCCQYKN